MRRRSKEGVRRRRAICPRFLRQISVFLLAAAANL